MLCVDSLCLACVWAEVLYAHNNITFAKGGPTDHDVWHLSSGAAECMVLLGMERTRHVWWCYRRFQLIRPHQWLRRPGKAALWMGTAPSALSMAGSAGSAGREFTSTDIRVASFANLRPHE